MREQDVYPRLTEIFRAVFDDDALVLTPDTDASAVEGWDSAAMVDLILAAEAEFGVRFTTREVDGLRRVADLAGLIAAKTPG